VIGWGPASSCSASGRARSLGGHGTADQQLSRHGLISGRSGVTGKGGPGPARLIHGPLVLVASVAVCSSRPLGCSQIAELNQAKTSRLPPICNVLARHLPLNHGPARRLSRLAGDRAEIGADPDVVGLVAALSSPSVGRYRLESDIDSAPSLPSASARRLQPPLGWTAQSRPAACPDPEPGLLVCRTQPRTHRLHTEQPSKARKRALGPASRTGFRAEAVATDFALCSACWLRCLHQSLLGIGRTLPALCSAGPRSGPLALGRQGQRLVAGRPSRRFPPSVRPSSNPRPQRRWPDLCPLIRSERTASGRSWDPAGRRPPSSSATRNPASQAKRGWHRAVQNGVAWWAEGWAVLDAQLEGRSASQGSGSFSCQPGVAPGSASSGPAPTACRLLPCGSLALAQPGLPQPIGQHDSTVSPSAWKRRLADTEAETRPCGLRGRLELGLSDGTSQLLLLAPWLCSRTGKWPGVLGPGPQQISQRPSH